MRLTFGLFCSGHDEWSKPCRCFTCLLHSHPHTLLVWGDFINISINMCTCIMHTCTMSDYLSRGVHYSQIRVVFSYRASVLCRLSPSYFCTDPTFIHEHLYPLQILLKMVAFRLKYFTHKFEVFDGMIVCISWTLDIASMWDYEWL